MKKILISFLIVFSLLIVLILFNLKHKMQPALQKRAEVLKVRCAIPYWDQEIGFSELKKHIDNCYYTSVFWYYLDDNQQIQKYESADEDSSVISFAHEHNAKILMTLTNLPEVGDWDSKRVEKVLASKQSRQKHIEEIAGLLRRLNFDGVLIDYEAVDVSQKNKFSDFTSELSEVLHKNNKLVAVSIHPKTKETLPTSDIGVFQDWGRIAKDSDIFSIMAYDHHYDTGSPGAVAPLNWVEDVVEFAKIQNVNLSKIFLGVSFTGFDWNVTTEEKAVSVSYEDAKDLALAYSVSEQWDSELMSPFIAYVKNGEKHEVWYENEKSIKSKMDFAKTSGLGGINLWYLGSEETPNVWQAVKQLKN